MILSPETAQKQQRNINIIDSDSVKKELSQHFGFTSSELDVLSQQAEVMQPVTRVVVRAPLSALDGIVQDGRIGTVSETRISNGLTAGADKNLDRLDEYISIRRQFELEKLGWNEGEPPIVYGFLGYSDELGDTNIQIPTYGRVELKLRADVANRSSFTIGDSLMKMHDDYPPEFLDHDDAVLVQQATEFGRQKQGHAINQVPYVEAQIHGGISTEDIESATITIKPSDIEQVEYALRELHAQSPECKIIVNADYTSSSGLPIDLVKSLDFVEFRPVVINRDDPIFIQRQTTGYETSGGNYQEHRYNETKERLSTLGRKFIEFFAEHDRPDNLSAPTLSHFRNGDRFPPKG